MEFTPDVLQRLAPSGEGLPVYLDTREPVLEDPSQQPAEHEWQPACEVTRRLVRCLEAIRNTSTGLVPITSQPRPDVNKRLLLTVINPIYTLATAVRDLFNYVQSQCWKDLDRTTQQKLAKRFQQFSAAVPTKSGRLKTARDKLAAHLDKDSSVAEYRQFWDSFGLADVVGWIKGCLRMLRQLVPPDLYSWTRPSGYSNVVNLMNVDGREVSLMLKGDQVEALVGFRFTVSPKAGFVREAAALSAAVEALEQKVGIGGGPDA